MRRWLGGVLRAHVAATYLIGWFWALGAETARLIWGPVQDLTISMLAACFAPLWVPIMSVVCLVFPADVHRWKWVFWLYPAVFVIMYRRMARKRLRRERMAAELCLECGYDLRATAERCPECGAAVLSGHCVNVT